MNVLKIMATIIITLPMLVSVPVHKANMACSVQDYQLIRVTAYAPFDNQSGMCNDGNPEVTSTGVRPGPAYCAVDPEELPYGTIIEVPGYGRVEAADTGGALRNHPDIAIDVYFDTYQEAIDWGVQYLRVKIIREEPSNE
jgi:3D (Asp-Asp-Asp) domain-containing protein